MTIKLYNDYIASYVCTAAVAACLCVMKFLRKETSSSYVRILLLILHTAYDQETDGYLVKYQKIFPIHMANPGNKNTGL